MANFGAKILNTAVSSVNAQQAVLAGIANNIANANTPGYTRRSVLLQNENTGSSSGGINIGSGVKVADLVRYVDEFTNKSLRESVSDKYAATTKDDMLARVESVFDLTGERSTIGGALTDFFSSLNDLAVNPSSIELRANVVQRGEDLVSAIQTSYQAISDLQQEIDDRLTVEVDAINSLTTQIADLNQAIAQVENGNTVAADERDRRDFLLEELAKKVSFSTLELSDGSVNVTLASGLDIVFGSNSRELAVTKSPTFITGSSPALLNTGVPSYVVFDYGTDSTPAHVDLTSDIASGSGTLAGLLQARGVYAPSDTSPFQAQGVLPETAARIEAIARFLLTDFNQAYVGADEDAGTAGHQASTGDLDGNAPSVYGFFDFQFSGSKDVDGDGLANDVGSHTNITNYASILRLTSADPRDVAIAQDQNAAPGATSFAAGDASNLSALADLAETQSTFSVGSYSFTGTVSQVYTDAVSYIGNAKSRASVDKTVADSNYRLAADRRDDVSAVSIDEEFSDLIRYQKAYEASARLIRMADELLEQIINTL
jgi:flagellar hook-associated protein 1 FlgK